MKRETLLQLAEESIGVYRAPDGSLYIDHYGLDVTEWVHQIVDRAVEHALQQAADRVIHHATVESLVAIHVPLDVNPREADARTHAAVVLATKEHL